MPLKKIFKKISVIPKLIKNEGLDAFYWRILKNLGIKLNYYSPIQKRKYLLQNKIIEITNSKVIDGNYKSLYLNCNNDRSSHDFSSKLLGCYEEEVQNKLIELAKKYKLKNIVNFGSAEGFHILGLLKNNFFENGFIFETNKKLISSFEDNKKKNNINNDVKIFNQYAKLETLEEYINEEDLKKTLFLVDIEGSEYEMFKNQNINKFKNSIFIIEDHPFYKKKDENLEFYNLIEKKFKVSYVFSSNRDPFKFKELNDFNDDDKWLLMSECRPKSMRWIVLEPLD